MTPLQAAMSYVQRGWHVFPIHGIRPDGNCACGRDCGRDAGKHPMTPNGHKDATVDPSAIREWFGNRRDVSVGIATGRTSGIVVIDVDPDHGGNEGLLDLEEQFGRLPETVHVMTGGGGDHFVFQYPLLAEGKCIPSRVNFGAPQGLRDEDPRRVTGVDIRAEGAYIVAPPSNHVSGGSYEFAQEESPNDVDLAALPETWDRALVRDSHETPEAELPDKDVEMHPEAARILRQLEERCRTAGDGERFEARKYAGLRAGRLISAGLVSTKVALKRLEAAILHNSRAPAWKVRGTLAAMARIGLSRPWELNEGPPPHGDSDAPDAPREPRKEADQASTVVDEWPDLIDLEDRESLPNMEPDYVPEPFRQWVCETAEQACLPIEAIAAPAITGVGSLLGSHVTVEPEGPGTRWIVSPNIWGALVAPPGSLKSHAIAESKKPIVRLATKAREEYEAQRIKADDDREYLTSMKTQLRRRKHEKAELEALNDQLRALDKLTLRRYTTSDATVEKLGEIMIRNPRGILLSLDELYGWFRSFKKQGHEQDRQFYLEAWNGLGGIEVDRVSRGELWVPTVCASVLGGIQPARLRSLIDATIKTGGEDGLLQRFQVLVWPDRRPRFANRIRSNPSRFAREQVYRRTEEIDEYTREKRGPYHFDVEAQKVFDDWRASLEARLERDTMHQTPAFEGHLAKYRSLVPSLSAIFHFVDGQWAQARIGVESLALAIRWTDYLELHAHKLYESELNPGLVAARGLARRLREGQWQHGDSPSELRQRKWPGLSSSDELASALNVLESRHWGRVVSVSSSSGKGRPRQVILLHPDIRSGDLWEKREAVSRCPHTHRKDTRAKTNSEHKYNNNNYLHYCSSESVCVQTPENRFPEIPGIQRPQEPSYPEPRSENLREAESEEPPPLDDGDYYGFDDDPDDGNVYNLGYWHRATRTSTSTCMLSTC